MAKLVKKLKTEKVQDIIDVSDIPGLHVIPINTRKFLQFNFDFTGPKVRDFSLPKIYEEVVKDSIVKVNISVRQEDSHKIDYKKFEDELKKYAYHVKSIVPVIYKDRRTRIENVTADLSPMKAIEEWLYAKGIENSEEILEMVKELIGGE